MVENEEEYFPRGGKNNINYTNKKRKNSDVDNVKIFILLSQQ